MADPTRKLESRAPMDPFVRRAGDLLTHAGEYWKFASKGLKRQQDLMVRRMVSGLSEDERPKLVPVLHKLINNDDASPTTATQQYNDFAHILIAEIENSTGKPK